VRKIKGKGSEDRVEVFLREKGFSILARNYRKVFGEIDIIAEKEGKVWFLEVKTVNKNFPPIEKIDKRKILRMVKVAETFMTERELNLPSRFFLVEVGEDIKLTEIDAW
jgi:putative endonuclease